MILLAWDRLVLLAIGKLLSKSQFLQKKRILSGIVIHTCYLITLETKAINHKFEARGGLHTEPDFVANEKHNYCSTNKRRMWTAEVFPWLRALTVGIPRTHMAAQNCLQLPSPGDLDSSGFWENQACKWYRHTLCRSNSSHT